MRENGPAAPSRCGCRRMRFPPVWTGPFESRFLCGRRLSCEYSDFRRNVAAVPARWTERCRSCPASSDRPADLASSATVVPFPASMYAVAQLGNLSVVGDRLSEMRRVCPLRRHTRRVLFYGGGNAMPIAGERPRYVRAAQKARTARLPGARAAGSGPRSTD